MHYCAGQRRRSNDKYRQIHKKGFRDNRGSCRVSFRNGAYLRRERAYPARDDTRRHFRSRRDTHRQRRRLRRPATGDSGARRARHAVDTQPPLLHDSNKADTRKLVRHRPQRQEEAGGSRAYTRGYYKGVVVQCLYRHKKGGRMYDGDMQ